MDSIFTQKNPVAFYNTSKKALLVSNNNLLAILTETLMPERNFEKLKTLCFAGAVEENIINSQLFRSYFTFFFLPDRKVHK